jgi:hypothetical protein
VITSPDNIRATSSTRSSGASGTTVQLVPRSHPPLATRQ